MCDLEVIEVLIEAPRRYSSMAKSVKQNPGRVLILDSR